MRGIVATLTAALLASGLATASLAATPSPLPQECGAASQTPPVARVGRPDASNVLLNGETKVGPPLLDIQAQLEAGDSFSCTITIRNRRQARTTYDLIPQGVLGGRDGARFVELDEPDADTTAASWLTAPRSVVIDPRGVARVPLTVTVPPDPPVGSAFGALTIAPRVRTSAGSGDTAVGIVSRIAVAVLLQVGGDGRAILRLQERDAPRLRWNRESWTWRATLVNRGTLHTSPLGRVRVRSIFGNTVSELRTSGRPLLPRGEQRLEETWKGVPWFGLYRWDARVSGRGQNADTVTPARASGWFVALPPWWIIVIVALALVMAVARGIARRHRVSEEDDEAAFGRDQ